MEAFEQSLRGIFMLLPPFLFVAGIIAAFAVAIAVWLGMKAHERIAGSMERMADALERRNHQA